MRDTLYVDIETRSHEDLPTVGVYRYVTSPDFRILMAAWAINDDDIKVETDPEAILSIPGIRPGTGPEGLIRVAHNAQFERVCFSTALGLPEGEYLPPHQWHDTQAIAAERGRPASLDRLAKALKVEEKDTAGKALINLFCKPRKDGTYASPEDHPEEWLEFMLYCEQDVGTLREVHKSLGGWPTATERSIWWSDQRINDLGVRIDMDMARAAYKAARENRAEHIREAKELTGADNPNSRDQLLRWLHSTGLDMPNLRAETVEKALRGDLEPDQRRVLELRQELALSASAKYAAALNTVSQDGRLRGGYRFFGAHTGRWSGRGVQPHNLPRAQLDTPEETDAAILDLALGEGADAYTLKALVRALFVGPFTVVDYSAIEARVIAWLAGEEWALRAFREGRDIYVETAERMGGGMGRSEGKIATLALGYNGAVGSLKAMGATGRDEELQVIVDQWRRANPNIVRFWKQLEDAFKRGGVAGKRVYVKAEGTTRRIVLPSGRSLNYHHCSFQPRVNASGKTEYITFTDSRGSRLGTYGGRLAENVTQAVARDILAEALVRLHEANYAVVGHVHDEILIQGVGEDSVKAVKTLMTISPKWADGLPIDAEGFKTERYRKG